MLLYSFRIHIPNYLKMETNMTTLGTVLVPHLVKVEGSFKGHVEASFIGNGWWMMFR